jgi:SPP1 family phage portal protein
MFYLSKDRELTPDLLYKMINHFQLTVSPKLTKYKNYYDGVHDILKKTYSDESKPCNKTVINYCKNITDSYTGYLATPGHISYSSDNDITDIMDILRYNDYMSEDSNLVKNALIHGVGYELMFIDSEAKTRFKLIDPLTCFGVYDNSLTADLLYFVRFYKMNDWDDVDLDYAVDVYNDNSVKHYIMKGFTATPVLQSEEPHYFGQCPANILVMPNEESVFDCVLSEQDSVNELVSAEIDDYAAFCDAYLAIEDADLDEETAKTMKSNRLLLLPAGSKAYWITKTANDAQVENILKRLHESIYRTAQCPDFSSESFVGGVSSGIAIQYRLTGMETRAGTIEAEIKKALQRRVEILCGMAALKLGEEVFRDIEITLKRNIPADEQAIVNIVNGLKGTVSDATLLSQIPFITDVEKELEKLNAQKKLNLDLYGGDIFDSSEDDSQEEENDDGTENADMF